MVQELGYHRRVQKKGERISKNRKRNVMANHEDEA